MEYEQSSSQPESKKSKYNDALATLMRIDEIWKRAYTHSSTGNLGRWNSDLDAVYRELSEDVAPGSDQEKEFNLINKELSEAGLFTLQNSKENGFKKNVEDTTNKRAMISIILNKKEVFLRRLKGKQGKGTVFEDSIDDYMD